MKNTQKKLKEKHFRYLSKENIENPMGYLNNFYKTETDLANWLDDLNALVNASFCAKMKGAHTQSNGYHCKKLIEQVEFAYSIFIRCNLKKKKGELNFQPVDYRQLQPLNKQKPTNTELWIFETLRLFFTFQDLKGWYKTLDRIWVNLIDMTDIIEEYERIGEDRLVIIKELFTRLAIALDLIYENGEMPQQADNSPLIMDTRASLETSQKTSQTYENIEKTNNKQVVDIDNIIQKKKHALSKIKTQFDITGLAYLQLFCSKLHLGINKEYRDWNEIFEFTEPRDIFFVYGSLRDLIAIINLNITSICSTNSEIVTEIGDIKYIASEQKEVKKLQFLSTSEISNPEYHFYLIHETYSNLDWTIKLDELFDTFLSLNKCEIIYDEGTPAIFLLHLEKLIELSYLIAFKDEIEFVDILTLENQEM